MPPGWALPMRIDHHTVVLLMRPPDAPTLPEPAAARLRDAHLAHQAGRRTVGLNAVPEDALRIDPHGSVRR